MREIFKEHGIEFTNGLERVLVPKTGYINIPSKVEAKLKYITKEDLLKVNKDVKLAKELILIIVSNFSNTHSLSLQGSSNISVKEGYKKLSSKFLQKQVNTGKQRTNPYKKIIDLLIKYGMVEKGRSHLKSERSNEYRLTSTFFGKGIVEYNLTDEALRVKNFKTVENNLKEVFKCPIATAELVNRQLIEFPTQEEAKKYLICLAKQKVTNKKNKVIVYLNKRNKDDFINSVFVEDYLKILEYLQKIIIPIVESEKGGNRVITTFNFLPSVLRPLCKFMGKPLVEADYTCLHPNICQMIYGGSNKEQITHDKVAKYLGIDKKIAKKHHLSFFNQTWEKMSYSPLFEYYYNNEPTMMKNLYDCKDKNGYKETSKKLFGFEVELMRQNIKDLSEKGIRVLTAFDAIYCSEYDLITVKKIMDKNAESFGIFSRVS